MPDKVVVQEAAPIKVSRAIAIRMWIGRFIVDYVETFLGWLPVTLFTVAIAPDTFHFSSLTEAKVAFIAWGSQLIAPGFAALVSAGRRALLSIPWSELKAWAQNGFQSK